MSSTLRIGEAGEGAQVGQGFAALGAPRPFPPDGGGEAEFQGGVEVVVRVAEHAAEQPVDVGHGDRAERKPPGQVDVAHRVEGEVDAVHPAVALEQEAVEGRVVLVGLAAEEGLDAEALDRLARRAGETEHALAHLTAEVEARLGADEAIDARALYGTPIAIVQRILSRRIAAAGGRDPSRIGLEKIETLAAGLRDALRERRAVGANVGGALVRLTVKGRLTFAPEPPRKGGKR